MISHTHSGAGWNCSSILLLVANVINLHKMCQCRCTVKGSWWWAERLPETCRVTIPIKLEFSASVGFIHRELRIVFGLIKYAFVSSEDTSGVSHPFTQMAITVTVGRFAHVKTILSGILNRLNYSITGKRGRESHNITWRAAGWTPLL